MTVILQYNFTVDAIIIIVLVESYLTSRRFILCINHIIKNNITIMTRV